ncbi:hypothetical protein MC378_09070 [Polaribacter sp. MSW13]|uniref:Adhesin domain-containing protein n=1 Tax=Polaribacter marinus TaxID=2916838 RepID=A0A9X1VMM2_9FLAO|nr:hypothetical protein [Polaribacter marinus]MCI2229314.1 hypothetical protein [Polaribacter marinus]
MKNNFIILFFLISVTIFSQKKVVKKFQTITEEIEISTIGLDDFVLENATSDYIEITLFAEDPNEQHILYQEENRKTKIEFFLEEMEHKDLVFRKYITKRLKRASAIIKIPKGKSVTILGENINIESKSYKGDLTIFIEKGILKLNKVLANVFLEMYAGNVFAALQKTDIEVTSNIGKIKIDDKLVAQKYLQKEKNNQYNFKINSIKANIFLTTK